MPHARVSLVTLIVLLSALVPAAVTAAPQTNAPPGNSAIDEYLETVPGASGEARPRAPRKPGAALTPAQRSELRALGAEGKALGRVVDATAPPPRASKPSAAAAPASGAGQSPVTAALAATTGSDDRSALGLLLPAILVASLIGAVALAMSRRRGRT